MSMLFSQSQKDIWNTANDNANTGIKTGFTYFDVLTSMIEKDVNNNPIFVTGGSLARNSIDMGISNSGKTTLLIQKGAAVVDSIEREYGPGYSDLVFIDVEKHSSIARIKSITGWNDVDILNKCRYIDEQMSLVDIFNLIMEISSLKEKLGKKYKMETTGRNLDGTIHFQYFPTVIVVDSLGMLRAFKSIKYNKDGTIKELENMTENIDAMRNAKDNTDFVIQVKNYCAKYNIHLHLITHTKEDVPMNYGERKTKYFFYLKTGATAKGGEQVATQAYLMSNITQGKALNNYYKDEMTYGDQIYGMINTFRFVKNKSGQIGVPYPLVFDNKKGFMPELSDFEYLTEVKYGMTGSGTYQLDILPGVKLTKKTVYEKCLANKFIARAIQFTARAHMYYTYVLDEAPPDFTEEYFINMSDEDRYNLIMTFTMDYPRYDKLVMPKELTDLHTKSKLKFNNNRGNSFFNYLADDVLFMKNRGFIMPETGVSLGDVMTLNVDDDNVVVTERGKYIMPK